MSLSLVRIAFEIAVLTTLAFGLTAGGWALAVRLGVRLPARAWLVHAQALLVVSVALPFGARVLLPGQLGHPPAVRDVVGHDLEPDGSLGR